MEFNSISEWEVWEDIGLSINDPTEVVPVSALIPVNSVASAVKSWNSSKASLGDISNVLSSSTEPSGQLVGMSLILSGNTLMAVVLPVVVVQWVRNSESSVSEGSDSLGSVVESPPLLWIFRVSWLSPQDVAVTSVLLSVNQLIVTELSVGKLELNSISEWVSWEVNFLGSVKSPSLMSNISAILPVKCSSVVVHSSVDTEASLTWVSQVHGVTIEVVNLIVHCVVVISKLMKSSLSKMLHLAVSESSQNPGSLLPGSDSFSSVIKYPP